MAKQQVSNETAIQYLRQNREFMEEYEARRYTKSGKQSKAWKPLEQYSRDELLRRYRGVIRAEATGKPVNVTELRRGKAKTPEHPLRVRHIKKHKGVADQYKIGSKQRQPTGEHLAKLRKKTSGNSRGEVVIVVHGLLLYEMPGGDQCLERTMSFKTTANRLDAMMEDTNNDLYEVLYLLSGSQRRWCEIWEISILPGFERKAA